MRIYLAPKVANIEWTKIGYSREQRLQSALTITLTSTMILFLYILAILALRFLRYFAVNLVQENIVFVTRNLPILMLVLLDKLTRWILAGQKARLKIMRFDKQMVFFTFQVYIMKFFSLLATLLVYVLRLVYDNGSRVDFEVNFAKFYFSYILTRIAIDPLLTAFRASEIIRAARRALIRFRIFLKGEKSQIFQFEVDALFDRKNASLEDMVAKLLLAYTLSSIYVLYLPLAGILVFAYIWILGFSQWFSLLRVHRPCRVDTVVYAKQVLNLISGILQVNIGARFFMLFWDFWEFGRGYWALGAFIGMVVGGVIGYKSAQVRMNTSLLVDRHFGSGVRESLKTMLKAKYQDQKGLFDRDYWSECPFLDFS